MVTPQLVSYRTRYPSPPEFTRIPTLPRQCQTRLIQARCAPYPVRIRPGSTQGGYGLYRVAIPVIGRQTTVGIGSPEQQTAAELRSCPPVVVPTKQFVSGCTRHCPPCESTLVPTLARQTQCRRVQTGTGRGLLFATVTQRVRAIRQAVGIQLGIIIVPLRHPHSCAVRPDASGKIVLGREVKLPASNARAGRKIVGVQFGNTTCILIPVRHPNHRPVRPDARGVNVLGGRIEVELPFGNTGAGRNIVGV